MSCRKKYTSIRQQTTTTRPIRNHASTIAVEKKEGADEASSGGCGYARGHQRRHRGEQTAAGTTPPQQRRERETAPHEQGYRDYRVLQPGALLKRRVSSSSRGEAGDHGEHQREGKRGMGVGIRRQIEEVHRHRRERESDGVQGRHLHVRFRQIASRPRGSHRNHHENERRRRGLHALDQRRCREEQSGHRTRETRHQRHKK